MHSSSSLQAALPPRSQLGASGTYLTAEEPSDSEILRTRTYDLTIT